MDYSFELNNARRDETFASGKIKSTSPVVEIFSALVDGKDLSKFGKKADVAITHMKGLAESAQAGDYKAMAELNEIRKFVIQPRLLQEIKLLGVFGSYKQLGWNEVPEIESIEIDNVRAEIQAEGQDVPTPFIRRKKSRLAPITISSGYKVNYRELAFGDFTNENLLKGEVIKEIRNKAALYVIETVFNAIDTYTGAVKYFEESAGLNKTGVDALLTKIRRYGKPNVIGDYAVLAQFLPWIGYSGNVGITGVSEKLLDEIADTGLVGTYNGSVLSEIPNGYNFNKLNTKGDNYDTLLPAGLAFVTPAAPINGVSAVQTFTVGGLTSFTGNSVSTGDILTRFDLAVAAGVAPGAEDTIGIIHDTNLDSL